MYTQTQLFICMLTYVYIYMYILYIYVYTCDKPALHSGAAPPVLFPQTAYGFCLSRLSGSDANT